MHFADHAAHEALLYDDDDQLLATIVPFVRAGLRAGERVLVALVPGKHGSVREALGPEAESVEFIDAVAMYSRNGPMLSSLLQRLATHAIPGEGRVRLLAEQALAARTRTEARAYMRYEAASNVAYERYAASVLCAYDTRGLSDSTLLHAQQTHPRVLDSAGDGGHSSDAFVDPREFIRRHSRVQPPPAHATEIPLETRNDLAYTRYRITEQARAVGLADAKIDELTVATTEVASNALLHGRAPRHVWTYTDDGAFVCHVHDAGPGLSDPLAGYLVPEASGLGGRGLWLAHQLGDIVEAASDDTGTHVTVRMTI